MNNFNLRIQYRLKRCIRERKFLEAAFWAELANDRATKRKKNETKNHFQSANRTRNSKRRI